MTFELEADGVRVSCNSARWTRRLVEKGARLVDPDQAEYLRTDAAIPEAAEPEAKGPKPLRG